MKLFYFFCILLYFVSCNFNDDKDALNLSNEQLKEIIRKKTPTPEQNHNDAILKLEENYQKDSNDLLNVYNLAFMKCTNCLQGVSSETKNCMDALTYFQRVKKINKFYRDSKAFYNSYLCYKKMEKQEEALKELDVFIKNNQNKDKIQVNFYLQRAELLNELGRNAEACDDLKRALKFDTMGYFTLINKIPCK